MRRGGALCGKAGACAAPRGCATRSAARLVSAPRATPPPSQPLPFSLCSHHPCLPSCSDETVLGSRIVELLRSTPLDEVPAALAGGSGGADAAAPAAASSSNGAANGAGSSNGAGNGAPPAAAAGPTEQQLTAGRASFERGSGSASFERRRSGAAASSSGTGGAAARRAPTVAAADAVGSGGGAAAREALGPEVTNSEDLLRLAEVVMGKVEEWDLLPGGKAASKAQRVREQLLDPQQRQRLEAIRRFAAAAPGAEPFPPPPVDAGANAPVDVGAGGAAAEELRASQGVEDFLPQSDRVLNL